MSIIHDYIKKEKMSMSSFAGKVGWSLNYLRTVCYTENFKVSLTAAKLIEIITQGEIKAADIATSVHSNTQDTRKKKKSPEGDPRYTNDNKNGKEESHES